MPSAQELVGALARLADERIGGAQVFATWTFRDPTPTPGSATYTSVGHGGGVRAVEAYLRDLADVYPTLTAFAAMEPHADRVAPHFHGLLGGLPSAVVRAIDDGRRGVPPVRGAPVDVRQARARFWERWFTDHGIARLESVDGDGASLYVAKYSLKGGSEVPWWRLWEPGELRNEWVRETHRRRRSTSGRRSGFPTPG